MDSGDQITVEMRLAAVEEKLDRLLAHLGLDGDGDGGPAPAVPAAPNAEAHIRALIQAGKKIQAIKAYREVTGQGLKEAKDAVEAMERNMRANGGWR
ncbi:ribosomal protein L7/L12 [Catenulispora sp. MAP5-51]|uniref:ribosomal protein L7/L12 n=1 Tax=Catenulispora sp. MAP5-51 TaxID=3156298 RepID=UPI0035127ABE